ncbi:anaphase-promoting complex [Salix suchowensis]|nr:anaphase-promoting complex [Salix suchowensis]
MSLFFSGVELDEDFRNLNRWMLPSVCSIENWGAESIAMLDSNRYNESEAATWHAVASWTWDAQDETCGICRMAFDGCCPDCKLPGDDCPLIWGACNHAFHLHCILKWVNSQTSQAHCPMCRREWQFKE